jgi:ornithine--oxo-acid transaminase
MRRVEILSRQVQANPCGGGNDAAATTAQQKLIDQGYKYGAHNYHPLPVVLSKGKGPLVWDTDGKQYYDFLSAYSAVNQGHCHPRIIAAMKAQADQLCLSSRAFVNDQYPGFCKFMSDTFKYDRVLPMNSGVEAGETAIKLCRRWAYRVKKVEPNKATVIFMNDNFWGRTISALSSSSDPDCYTDFGPYTPGFKLIPYNDPGALEAALQADPNIGGVYLEPIQGEAGVNVPADNYLQEVRRLTKKYNCLMIADEVQTGLCRTGKLLCCDHAGVRPDMVVLGKALSGGTMPVSAVLADSEVMLTIGTGEHGSTFGGNPLACAIATESIKVLLDEKLAENAEKLGEIFRAELKAKIGHLPFVELIRGKGLLNAIIVDKAFVQKVTAWQLCMKMRDEGVLAKQTHDNIIRFAPPLVINETQLRDAMSRIVKVFTDANK